MKAYQVYKDSGHGWAGYIPATWKMMQLKFLTENHDGKRVPVKAEDRGDMQGEYPYYGANGIIDYVNDYLFDGEYLLIGEDGAPFFLPQDVAFVASGKFWVNNHAHILKTINGSDVRFLKYSLNTVDYREYITGSTRDKLTQSDLSRIKLPIPTLSEQQAIADFLDRKTAQINTLIEKKQRQIDLLQEQRTALINHAVTKGLRPDVRMKDSGVEWLGEIPSGWTFRKNGTLFDQRDERNSPELPLLHVSIHTGVTLREFSSDRVEQMASDWSTYKKAEKGDIAFNKMRMWQGAVGVAPVTGLVSSDYTVAKPRMNVNPFYFEYQFRTHGYKTEINRNSHGIVPDRNRLYWDDFKQMQSLYPPFEEQNDIVDYLSIELGKIEKATQKISKEIELIQEYRMALISEAVTGKIAVHE